MTLWMVLPNLPSPAIRTAQFLAVTASVASTETVIAVPSAMPSTDRMPASHKPLSKANESTISAPEQGLMPTAATADQAVRQSKRSPERSAGSGAWE